MIQICRLVGLTLALLCAACFDLTRHKIPNTITLSATIYGILLSVLEGWISAKDCLIGFAAALVVGMALWMMGAFRAGDAKLYGAVGALMGSRGVLDCFLWSMLVAGGLGLLLLWCKHVLWERLKRVGRYLKGIVLTMHFVPYVSEPGSEHELPLAPAIAIGAALAVFVPVFSS